MSDNVVPILGHEPRNLDDITQDLSGAIDSLEHLNYLLKYYGRDPTLGEIETIDRTLRGMQRLLQEFRFATRPSPPDAA